MSTLKRLIDLLLHEPALPNTVIATRAGCERRRVRRYRRLLQESGLTAEHLHDCDARLLHTLFNPRTAPQRHASPDFGTLASTHPKASGRVLWRHYTQATATATAPARPSAKSRISYAQFMRRRAQHGVVSSSAPRCSS